MKGAKKMLILDKKIAKNIFFISRNNITLQKIVNDTEYIYIYINKKAFIKHYKFYKSIELNNTDNYIYKIDKKEKIVFFTRIKKGE